MPSLLIPFAAQLLLSVGALAIARPIARAPKPLWIGVCLTALGTILLWPLMRVFPVQPIDWLGAPLVACIELTGLAIPAVLFFAVAARHVPKKSDQRAILLLTVFAAIYFVKAGFWMISPGIGKVGPTNFDRDGICRQSTGYTCVAASMVTMLKAHGIASDEAEMASLSHTQVGGGATDSRAMWALERKLKDSDLHPRYLKLDRAGLIAAPKPCMVQLDWGFFVSHMVPVLSATNELVVIGDPINGRHEMTMPDFVAKWKGLAITLEQKREPPTQP